MSSSTAAARPLLRGASSERTGDALLRLGMRLYRLELEALKSVSVPLSVRQYRILDRVEHQIVSITQLAALARRQLPTISRSVDSLVRHGLLVRHPLPADRRVTALELTPAGKKILGEARTALQVLAAWVGEAFDIKVDPAQLSSAVDAVYTATQSQLRTNLVRRGEHSASIHRLTSDAGVCPTDRP